jgi:hypothetical protein
LVPSFETARQVAFSLKIEGMKSGARVSSADVIALESRISTLELEKEETKERSEAVQLEILKEKYEIEKQLEDVTSALRQTASEYERLREDRADMLLALDAWRNGRAMPIQSVTHARSWCRFNLRDEVLIAERAFECCEELGFHRNPEHIADGLRFLSECYVPYRLGEMVPAAYHESCKERNWEPLPPLSNMRSARNYGRQYFVEFEGKDYMLDLHIKRNGDPNKQVHVRIYFTWDEERKVLIIGHMPWHLDNSKTN